MFGSRGVTRGKTARPRPVAPGGSGCRNGAAPNRRDGSGRLTREYRSEFPRAPQPGARGRRGDAKPNRTGAGPFRSESRNCPGPTRKIPPEVSRFRASAANERTQRDGRPEYISGFQPRVELRDASNRTAARFNSGCLRRCPRRRSPCREACRRPPSRLRPARPSRPDGSTGR